MPASVDAVMVLSSGITNDTTITGNGLDRLLSGIELLQKGASRRLVTSRIFVQRDHGGTSDVDQQRIITMTNLSVQWDIVPNVHSTRDEAVGAARLLLPAGARSIVVVTSPMHTRRACAVFEGVGFKVACQPARERDYVTINPRGPDDRLEAFREYVYERLGMVKYRWKGWI